MSDRKSVLGQDRPRGDVATGHRAPATHSASITSTGVVIRGNQDLANSKGYRDAVAEIQRLRETNKR